MSEFPTGLWRFTRPPKAVTTLRVSSRVTRQVGARVGGFPPLWTMEKSPKIHPSLKGKTKVRHSSSLRTLPNSLTIF